MLKLPEGEELHVLGAFPIVVHCLAHNVLGGRMRGQESLVARHALKALGRPREQ